jgi:transketolase
VENDHGDIQDIKPIPSKSKLIAAPTRDKKIKYIDQDLPILDKTKEYSASSIITQSMRIFARDTRVVSIDSDLASTSGLEAGVSYVDSSRALNVGVAEANMMNIAEAYAVTGHNVWISTFCPFFDWKVLRRIAISYQELKEVIDSKGGWLTPGHNLNITFIATAPNFETITNGATHMGNDDLLTFDAVAHLNIIDCSCPNQLLGIMKWIMEGNKGLVYLRIMRASSKVIYDEHFNFQFSKGYKLRQSDQDKAIIISSGRGVHEALVATDELKKSGLCVSVVDMPSIDRDLLIELSKSGKYLIVAEQNNGYIMRHLKEYIFNDSGLIDKSRIISINTLDSNGKPRFIHSGTYQELLQYCGLSSKQLVEKIKNILL